jgi:asparagine synthase (glutamine-hydrolysing)
MSGIAGIAADGKRAEVERMLDRIAHRGRAGRRIIEMPGATLGIVWTEAQATIAERVVDGLAADRASDSRYACAEVTDGHLVLERDPLGVAPLYYGASGPGDLCFASEVKALLPVTSHVHEFPPGHSYRDGQFTPYFQLRNAPPVEGDPEHIAMMLRQRLHSAVDRRLLLPGVDVGVWLSGGLDSSALAALARPLVRVLRTFAVGVPDAPDLEHARAIATTLKTDHHEIGLHKQALHPALPEVIYHLESFDVRVVRSGLINWLAGRVAAQYVSAVLSGEGADELFAGYPYFDAYGEHELPAEVLRLVSALHNTSLQRADRCAAAHGIVAYIPFCAGAVVEYALRIPADLKRKDGIEKWILRLALKDCLPEAVLWRKQARTFLGAGIGTIMAEYAETQVTEADFERGRVQPYGWILHSKEEFLYYRIFAEQFGVLNEFTWMTRSQGKPL